MSGKSIIAKRLGEARVRSGLSQKKLGILAGIDEFSASPRINQYERGKYAPDFRTIERIAKVLGVPSAYFYAVEDDLAAWILAFAEARPAVRRRCLRELANSRSGG